MSGCSNNRSPGRETPKDWTDFGGQRAAALGPDRAARIAVVVDEWEIGEQALPRYREAGALLFEDLVGRERPAPKAEMLVETGRARDATTHASIRGHVVVLLVHSNGGVDRGGRLHSIEVELKERATSVIGRLKGNRVVVVVRKVVPSADPRDVLPHVAAREEDPAASQPAGRVDVDPERGGAAGPVKVEHRREAGGGGRDPAPRHHRPAADHGEIDRSVKGDSRTGCGLAACH